MKNPNDPYLNLPGDPPSNVTFQGERRRLAAKLPRTMRRDPGENGSVSFGFVDLPARGEKPLIEPHIEYYPSARGQAQRDLMIEKGENIHISLHGWYSDKVSLSYEQANHVLDALVRMLSPQ